MLHKTLTSCVVAGLILGATATAAAERIGRIKLMTGEVELERNAQRQPAVLGQLVESGDRLYTGADSAVGILFDDDTRMGIGPDAQLDLSSYRFDPISKEGSFSLALPHGSLAAVAGKLMDQGAQAINIQTPGSGISIRDAGTEFAIRVDQAN